MSKKVVTGEVRFSFPHLFEPHAFDPAKDTPKYSTMILIPKSDKKTVEKIRAAEETAIAEGIATVWGGKKPKKINSVIKDGDDDADEYPEREGHWFMSVRSNTRPQVVDATVQPIIDASEIYSGMYGRVSINAFAYSHAGNNGVGFGLNNVQKTADGESLAGGTTAEEDFDPIDDFDEDDDDLI